VPPTPRGAHAPAAGVYAQAPGAQVQAPPVHSVLPPAQRARRAALVLSAIAVAFSLACGVCGRRAFALREDPDLALPWVFAFLVLLLIALLLRMAGAICELFWLERTWSNIPEPLRRVGPIHDVSSGMAIAVSFVPGVAWVWKLGLVIGIADGFEVVRTRIPFTAAVPKGLGMAAVIVGWIPGLNVYVAPFLWRCSRPASTHASSRSWPRSRADARAGSAKTPRSASYFRRTDLIVMLSFGASLLNGPFAPVGTETILSTTSIPEVTVPKTAYPQPDAFFPV
jgi:hypothetical protein